MKFFSFVLLVALTWINVNGQTVDTINQEVAPAGGINELAIKYYGIDFTKEQRKAIESVVIEFIFSIDTLGNPTLAEINGVTSPDIIDSLRQKTNEIPRFNPKIRNGQPVPSIYFMKLVFPTYKMTQRRYGILQSSAYQEAKLDDFEYIKESGQRLDVLFSPVANQFLGRPAPYLALGGGMKTMLEYTGKNNLLYGMNMEFYGNKLKQNYPINTTRVQSDVPATVLMGLIVGKWYDKFNVQGEVNYALQSVTEKLDVNDSDWIQLRGWSPGVVVNYPIALGKQIMRYYNGSPSVIRRNLNLHFGLRYLSLSLKEATGMMVEIGVGYRVSIRRVEEYKLKEEYLSN